MAPGNEAETPISKDSPPKSQASSTAPRFTGKAADLRLWHQRSSLSFAYVRPVTGNPAAWCCQGRTVLYVVDEAEFPECSLSLHLKGTCSVTNIKVEAVSNEPKEKTKTGTSASLVPLSVLYHHIDPLAHVLVKPSQSYVDDDGVGSKYDADSQFHRGAMGMTTGLRAASIASNMGELRLSVSDYNRCQRFSKDEITECWKTDIEDNRDGYDGKVEKQLTSQLYGRTSDCRSDRIKLVANRMAEASSREKSYSSSHRKAMKLTIDYQIELGEISTSNMGGIHSHADLTPHIYTTSGIVGDHEGPRSWIPCLDSASSKHRASHELVIKVSAPMKEGLSSVGCGEDFGTTATLLHDLALNRDDEEQLGRSHLSLVKGFVKNMVNDNSSALHVIPSGRSVDSILATCIWCSTIWNPIPARSMGFAVGPFKALYDPEYYSQSQEDESQEGRKTTESQSLFAEKATSSGEGIRQVYFAPLFERQYIHAEADRSLLANTEITLLPLGRRHVEMSESFEQTVEANTNGVTNRALSLMRDILALPTYRTASYTQIWIPNAVHGGSTSGSLHCCPEVLVNPFLGGAVMDSKLLPPVGGFRLPYYSGGRSLQFLQARCAIRGWLVAALPLGGHDDVGFGYIHTLFECFIMSVYDRAHGAQGEGGASDGVFFTRRYAVASGLNSRNLDFLPVPNIEEEELDMVVGGVVGAVPIEDRNNDQLWRSASNGSESHTSAMDEFACRQVLLKDVVDAFERGTDKDKGVPLPGFGWRGSHLSLSFLSSNAASSSALGCGSLELVHPVGGALYRTLKCQLLRRVVEGRAGISNFIRVIRAAFVAAHIEDKGDMELKIPSEKDENPKENAEKSPEDDAGRTEKLPRFGLCVDEILKKHGLTHSLFTVALRKLAGHREPHLRGTLVDVERENRDALTNAQVVEPEGFPNSYVRGASEMYLRVGTHVEPAGTADGGGSSQTAAAGAKRFQLHVFAEPIIPEGGIVFSGPVTLRVVENEGQNHFVVRTLKSDGSRCDWGPVSLHTTKPVTTVRQQTAASGAIEGSTGQSSASLKEVSAADPSGGASKHLVGRAERGFNEAILHGGGYQAIELMRLTNRTPLLWVRVDPQGLYGGRISVFQPDACLAEQLFHDGDAGAQIDAIRTLAERPLRVQGSVKVSTVYDVNVSELPVRVLGDCLRGAPALHSSLPHTPAVRAQAALAIAQWQNNKAPVSAGAVGGDSWVGLNLLMQYFTERYYRDGVVVPVKHSRVAIMKNESGVSQSGHAAEAGAGSNPTSSEDMYQYMDTIISESEKTDALRTAEGVEVEEDEEYRVISAVLTAIASVRAKDGKTPLVVLRFMESLLLSGNLSTAGNMVSPDEGETVRTKRRTVQDGDDDDDSAEIGYKRSFHGPGSVADLSYVTSLFIADTLLALCHLNVSPSVYVDPTTGKQVQSKAKHPAEPLLKVSRQWLEWELYRETMRMEKEHESITGIGGACHSPIAACAITAMYSLAILRRSTMDPPERSNVDSPSGAAKPSSSSGIKRKHALESRLGDETTSQFYMNIFDEEPRRSDVTRAACAQAVACICCAADRFDDETQEPLGLLTALEFLLQRILDNRTTPGLRQTLSLLMMDSCTGKVCSMQRVGTIGGRGDLCTSSARFMTGPLGASHGGDNGSALLMTVSESSYPAANAVNDGARRGLRLLTRAGHPHDTQCSDHIVVRVAKFASLLWRTINGDHVLTSVDSAEARRCVNGVCSSDAILRCTLLGLWQWIWPKGCFAVLRVQSWRSLEDTPRYRDLGAGEVIKTADEEKTAAQAEEVSLAQLNNIVAAELDRQLWRGEMASTSWRQHRAERKGSQLSKDGSSDQGIGQPLPPVKRDNAFKQGGWISSTAQQRRAMTLDGGSVVTKIRLTLKNNS